MMKGVACQIMIFAHAITMNFESLSTFEKVFFTVIIYPAGLFFFASGINVVLFQEHAAVRRGFQATKFFLAASALLLVLSLPYSINRHNLYVLQIFQGIAVTTAATYLLLRIRASNKLLVALAFGFYLIWFRYWREIMPELAELRDVPTNMTFRATLVWLRGVSVWKRFLFANFSLFPWVSYVMVGAAWYRSQRDHPEHEKRWIALFVTSILFGVISLRALSLDQPVLLDNFADMLFRNAPVHFFTWMGLTGLTAMWAAKAYRGGDSIRHPGRRRLLSYVEYSGKESLMFFVWHWVLLFSVGIALSLIGNVSLLGQGAWKTHLTWIVSVPLVAASLPWIVSLGHRWRKTRNFQIEAFLLLVAGSIVAYAVGRNRYQVTVLGFFISLAASIAFAVVYPELREQLRRHFTDKV